MKKQNIQIDKFKKITVVFSYTLFAIFVIALIVSTAIPVASLFLSPTARHFNVAVLLVSLIAGAVLPPLVSYLIGDRATHSKSKLDHHFNGVLFGIAAYWLSSFLFFIGSDVVSGIRSEFSEPLASVFVSWPIFATVAILAVIAVGYARSKNKDMSILEYKPFQVALLLGMASNFAVSSSLYYVIAPVLLMILSYIMLPAGLFRSLSARLAGAGIALSAGYIVALIAGELLPYKMALYAPIVVWVGTLFLYVILVRRAR